jgi:hypothetical protein
LDGGEVGADDGGGGVLVGEVNGPDAGAGADVEDLVGGVRVRDDEWREGKVMRRTGWAAGEWIPSAARFR